MIESIFLIDDFSFYNSISVCNIVIINTNTVGVIVDAIMQIFFAVAKDL